MTNSVYSLSPSGLAPTLSSGVSPDDVSLSPGSPDISLTIPNPTLTTSASLTQSTHPVSSADVFSVCLWNSRSLVNKLRNFQSFVYSSSFQVFALTETWLSPFILSGEVIPSGFTVYRHDRTSRGGVLLAVHHSFSSHQLSSPSHLEIVCVKIITGSPVVICLVYIPPNSYISYYSEVFHYLESISSGPRSIILGDFNLPDIIMLVHSKWPITFI